MQFVTNTSTSCDFLTKEKVRAAAYRRGRRRRADSVGPAEHHALIGAAGCVYAARLAALVSAGACGCCGPSRGRGSEPSRRRRHLLGSRCRGTPVGARRGGVSPPCAGAQVRAVLQVETKKLPTHYHSEAGFFHLLHLWVPFGCVFFPSLLTTSLSRPYALI